MKFLNKPVHLIIISTGLLIIGAVSFVGCRSSGPQDTLRVRRLEIVDDKGKTQGILFADKDGAVLSLNDSDGKPRIVIAAGATKPSLEIYDATGKVRLIASVEKDGSALAINNGSGIPVATIGYYQDQSWVAVNDPAGNLVARLPAK